MENTQEELQNKRQGSRLGGDNLATQLNIISFTHCLVNVKISKEIRYSRSASIQSPSVTQENLQRKSHKPYGPPTSVTWRLLLSKQANTTGNSTALIAGTHDFAHSPDLCHDPRLVTVTCAWSWRRGAINPAITFTNTSKLFATNNKKKSSQLSFVIVWIPLCCTYEAFNINTGLSARCFIVLY